MEHCEERMISLAKELGLDEEKEQAFFAVIKCFANAIELVNDEIKEFLDMFDFSSINNTEYYYALNMLCGLLDVGTNYANSAKISFVKRELKRVFGDYNYDEMMSKLNDGLDKKLVISKFDMKLIGSFSFDKRRFKEHIRIIREYLNPFCRIYFNGRGLTFKKWESMAFTFSYLDSMNLSFLMLDTLI